MVVGRVMNRRDALFLHLLLTGIGLALGAVVAFQAGNVSFVGIQLLAAVLLYGYSQNFKRQLLAGNFIVALLTALAVLIEPIYEIVSISVLALRFPVPAQTLINILLFYTAFAFITTLTREIVKDAEDMVGDLDSGCKTLPIVAGIPFVKKVVNALLLLIMLGVGFVIYILSSQPTDPSWLSLIYLGIIEALCIYALIQTFSAKLPTDFASISGLLKLIMLAGICYLPVFSISVMYEGNFKNIWFHLQNS
jgi:4-hydroxybenzoate polyprenyltransferase